MPNYGNYGTYVKTDNTGRNEYRYYYNAGSVTISANQPVVLAPSATITTRTLADGTTAGIWSIDHIYLTTTKDSMEAIGVAIQKIAAGDSGWVQTKGFYPTVNMCADMASAFGVGVTVGTAAKAGYATYGIGLGRLVEEVNFTGGAGLCADDIAAGIPTMSGIGIIIGGHENHTHGILSAGYGWYQNAPAAHRIEGNLDHVGNINVTNDLSASRIVASSVVSTYSTADLYVDDLAVINGPLTISSTTAADSVWMSANCYVANDALVGGDGAGVLRVSGDADVTGDVTVGDDGTGNLLVWGTMSCDDTITGAQLNISGTGDFDGDVTVGDDGTGNLLVWGTMSCDDVITGAQLNISGTGDFDGDVTVGDDGTGNLLVWGTMSCDDTITGAAANISGDVDMTGALIAANTRISGNALIVGDTTVGNDGTGNLLVWGTISGDDTATVNQLQVSGDANVGNDALVGGDGAGNLRVSGDGDFIGDVEVGADGTGNLLVWGTMSCDDAITGASLGTTGNLTADNISATGNLTADTISALTGLETDGYLYADGAVRSDTVSAVTGIQTDGYVRADTMSGVTSIQTASLTATNATATTGLTAGAVSSTGNLTADAISATGNLTAAQVNIPQAASAEDNLAIAITGVNAWDTAYGINMGNVSGASGVNYAIYTRSGSCWFGDNTRITGDISASGNVNAANMTAGTISSQGGITVDGAISGDAAVAGGTLHISGTGDFDGDVTVGDDGTGNLLVWGTMSCDDAITGASLGVAGNLTADNVSATGNLTAATISALTSIQTASLTATNATATTGLTAGAISSTGNLTADTMSALTGLETDGYVYADGAVRADTVSGVTSMRTASLTAGTISATGAMTGASLSTTGDIQTSLDVQAGTGLRVAGDEGTGVAGMVTFTNVSAATAAGTPTLASAGIFAGGMTTNDHWLKMYIGTTIVYVPGWSASG